MRNDGILRLRRYIEDKKIDGILISSVPNIAYLTNFHRFYKDERDGYFLVTKQNAYLITSPLYAQAFRGRTDFKLVELSAKNPTKKAFEKLRDQEKISILSVEEYDLRASEYKYFKKIFKKLKKFVYPEFRALKTNQEINLIKKACQVGDLAFENVLKYLKVGVTEKEVASEIKKFVLNLGFEMSFPTIVAFGKNAAIPHHQTGDTKLKKGQFVLMDFGVEVEGYCSDMTRSLVFGKASIKQRKIYQAVIDAQEKSISYIESCLSAGKKVFASEVDLAARNFVEKSGFGEIIHSIGHGVGLEVHEEPSLWPKSKDILKEGMVFSIEPGVYLPEFGGVRIEDLFTIKGKKLVQITNSKKKLIELI